MKRALAIAVALCALGVIGFSQLSSISGDWSFTFRVLGTTTGARSSVLNLKTTINGWTISSKTSFGDTDQTVSGVQFGFTEQAFGVKGVFGPFTIDGSMAFNAGVTKIRCWECINGVDVATDYVVTPPAYKSASLSTSLEFSGLNIGLKVEHWAYPYECPWPCTQTGSHMLYTFTLGVPPVELAVTFEDCCTGIMFGDFTLTMTGVGLCCGITYDMELYFTKAGFEYVLFSINDFFAWCCGISFDLEVEFGVDYKEVTLTPKFAGLGEACVTLYGDIIGWNEFQFAGLVIYGFKIGCSLGDCGLLEFVTVLQAPPYEDCDYPSWYYPFYYYGGDEYIRMKFCGAGCCGGTYTVDFYVHFDMGGTGLFDLYSLRGIASIPIMANLNATISLTLPLTPGATTPTLDLGWKFTF
ncbi:hypothetical protein H5T54_04150 [Candidatus Bipolaricaulota bacterium]|nr:hypothetical protein [Candidatus Bipolaricaulota bacterium]